MLHPLRLRANGWSELPPVLLGKNLATLAEMSAGGVKMEGKMEETNREQQKS